MACVNQNSEARDNNGFTFDNESKHQHYSVNCYPRLEKN